MKDLSEFLANKHIRLIDGHPDDNIQHSHAIETAMGAGSYVDEALLTLGTFGKNLRANREKDFSVLDGFRIFEQEPGIERLNVQELFIYEGIDGKLQQQVNTLAPIVGQDAVRDTVDVFISTGNLTDHDDHKAAGLIAYRAALWAAEQGRHIDVLQLHHYQGGNWFASATESSMRSAFLAAEEHSSQWRFSPVAALGYRETPGDLFLHRDDYEALDQYPLTRYATYSLAPPPLATVGL